MSPEERLGHLLSQRGWRIAVAETTSGGLICHRLVAVPGSSKYFERGIVAYSRASKLDLPGVPADLLDRFGSVSPEVSVALAEGVRRLGGAEVGIAETGIAGPIRGRSPKPVGACHLALSAPSGTRSEERLFHGERVDIQRQIAQRAIEMTVEYLEGL
ncbi:MAG: CinA family protein [Candidatus Latescibacteria bacterium]|nr:CinA family protein [Candidatus Latescibacterota bacterium]